MNTLQSKNVANRLQHVRSEPRILRFFHDDQNTDFYLQLVLSRVRSRPFGVPDFRFYRFFVWNWGRNDQRLYCIRPLHNHY